MGVLVLSFKLWGVVRGGVGREKKVFVNFVKNVLT